MDGLNDNRRRPGFLEPDENRAYVRNYLKEMLAHFEACGIDCSVIVSEMSDAIIKVAPGKPYEKRPDEGDLLTGLYCLIPAASSLQERVDAYSRAQTRAQRGRIEDLAERHKCSIDEAAKIYMAAQDLDDPRILKTGLPAGYDDQAGL